MTLPAWATKPAFAAIIYGANVILFVIALAAIGNHLAEVTTFLMKLPAPIATLVVGIAGFGGIAWQAKIGFANLVKAQEHRARIESEGRRELAEIQQQQSDRDRQFEMRTLAASLHGELTALLSRIHAQRTLIYTQWKIYEAAATDRHLRDVESPMIPTSFSVPVFESCIPKLGLLGPSVAGDVVEVFSRATTKVPAEVPKFKPEQLAFFYKALHDGWGDWGDEIVRVGQRLGHLQWGGPDPGTLYQMRQEKTAEKARAAPAE